MLEVNGGGRGRKKLDSAGAASPRQRMRAGTLEEGTMQAKVRSSMCAGSWCSAVLWRTKCKSESRKKRH